MPQTAKPRSARLLAWTIPATVALLTGVLVVPTTSADTLCGANLSASTAQGGLAEDNERVLTRTGVFVVTAFEKNINTYVHLRATGILG